MTTESSEQTRSVGNPPPQEQVDAASDQYPAQPSGFESGADPGAGATEHPLIGDPAAYATRWEAIQVGFVDDPRSAVQEAEMLVADVMTEVARNFQQQKQNVEAQWSGGTAQASTDDLRMAFQCYRGFFQRLLHA
jgi:hypothetical protein